MSGQEKQIGLYGKYHVDRVDGKPITQGCIVLEFKDPIARPAIQFWAETMREAGYHQVHADVMAKLQTPEEAKVQ